MKLWLVGLILGLSIQNLCQANQIVNANGVRVADYTDLVDSENGPRGQFIRSRVHIHTLDFLNLNPALSLARVSPFGVYSHIQFHRCGDFGDNISDFEIAIVGSGVAIIDNEQRVPLVLLFPNDLKEIVRETEYEVSFANVHEIAERLDGIDGSNRFASHEDQDICFSFDSQNIEFVLNQGGGIVIGSPLDPQTEVPSDFSIGRHSEDVISSADVDILKPQVIGSNAMSDSQCGSLRTINDSPTIFVLALTFLLLGILRVGRFESLPGKFPRG